MRTGVRNVTALSLFLACVGVALAGGDDARGVIEKSIQAIGGETKIAKHNAFSVDEKGTYYGMGDGLPYTAKLSIQWPEQMYLEIESVFTIVLDGDKGWIAANGDVKEMSAEQLATQRHDQRVGWMSTLVPLLDKAFTLKSRGITKSCG